MIYKKSTTHSSGSLFDESLAHMTTIVVSRIPYKYVDIQHEFAAHFHFGSGGNRLLHLVTKRLRRGFVCFIGTNYDI